MSTYNPMALRVHFGEGAVGPSSNSDVFFKLATYPTPDTAATVETAHYFDVDWQRLTVGMVIMAVMNFSGPGSTPVGKNYVVTASSASGVTVAVFNPAAG
jgi:hypothetical protein